jgi:hypothetical protein
MSWIIIVVIIIIGVIIKNAAFKKIDESEQKALKTPGQAIYLRNHYSDVIDSLMQKNSYQILFERSDMIKIGESETEYFSISNYSGGVFVAYVHNGIVWKEWKFSRGESSAHIIYELNKI